MLAQAVAGLGFRAARPEGESKVFAQHWAMAVYEEEISPQRLQLWAGEAG
jgi:hypothetical protein